MEIHALCGREGRKGFFRGIEKFVVFPDLWTTFLVMMAAQKHMLHDMPFDKIPYKTLFLSNSPFRVQNVQTRRSRQRAGDTVLAKSKGQVSS